MTTTSKNLFFLFFTILELLGPAHDSAMASRYAVVLAVKRLARWQQKLARPPTEISLRHVVLTAHFHDNQRTWFVQSHGCVAKCTLGDGILSQDPPADCFDRMCLTKVFIHLDRISHSLCLLLGNFSETEKLDLVRSYRTVRPTLTERTSLTGQLLRFVYRFTHAK